MALPLFHPPRHFLLLLALALPPATHAAPASPGMKTWTSFAGTQIEAEHVATIGGDIWLRDKDGRLLKIAPPKLAALHQAELAPPADAAGEWQSVHFRLLYHSRKDPALAEVAEILVNTVVSTFSCSGLSFDAALREYAEAITAHDPQGRRIEFRIDPALPTRTASMSIRNLNALRGLQILCGNQPGELVMRLVPGGVEITPSTSSASSARASLLKATPASTPSHSEKTKPAANSSTTRKCELHSAAKNWLRGGDFELQSKAWEVANQPKAFKRGTPDSGTDSSPAPVLGDKVMIVTPGPIDPTHGEGPPYLTQTVKFPRKPKRLLLCADVLNTSNEGITIRFSASDPKVVYTHGSGNTFPFSQVPARGDTRWQHLEWEADLGSLKNNELTFGLMFPSRGGPWHCDNIALRTLEE